MHIPGLDKLENTAKRIPKWAWIALVVGGAALVYMRSRAANAAKDVPVDDVPKDANATEQDVAMGGDTGYAGAAMGFPVILPSPVGPGGGATTHNFGSGVVTPGPAGAPGAPGAPGHSPPPSPPAPAIAGPPGPMTYLPAPAPAQRNKHKTGSHRTKHTVHHPSHAKGGRTKSHRGSSHPPSPTGITGGGHAKRKVHGPIHRKPHKKVH